MGDRWLNKKQAAAKLGVCRKTLWKWLRDGVVPRPRRITDAYQGWPESVLDEWIRTRPEVEDVPARPGEGSGHEPS